VTPVKAASGVVSPGPNPVRAGAGARIAPPHTNLLYIRMERRMSFLTEGALEGKDGAKVKVFLLVL